MRPRRRKGGYNSWIDAIRDITEQAPAAVAMFDDKMRFLAVSRRFVSDNELGEAAKVIGRSIYETFPDMPPRWREIHVRVLAGEELSEEDFFPRQDGRIRWARWSMKPWRTADARISGAMLFAESITEQVEARRALADSEAAVPGTALFCYIDHDMGRPQWADVGMYLQTVMLLLRAEGLHSCAQMAWSQVRETVAEVLSPWDGSSSTAACRSGTKTPP